MEAILQAEPRTETGKGPAHRLRASGRVPAVLYGAGVDPTPIHVSALDLLHVFHAMGQASVLVDLKLDGHEYLTIAREIQRDLIHNRFIHIDFMAVNRDEKITVNIELHEIGDSGRRARRRRDRAPPPRGRDREPAGQRPPADRVRHHLAEDRRLPARRRSHAARRRRVPDRPRHDGARRRGARDDGHRTGPRGGRRGGPRGGSRGRRGGRRGRGPRRAKRAKPPRARVAKAPDPRTEPKASPSAPEGDGES